MYGPGKYDDACTSARESTGAMICVLVVINGNKGDGFSCQALGMDPSPYLPDILRTVANGIENSVSPEEQ